MADAHSLFSAASWAYRLLTDKPDRTLLICNGKKINASTLNSEVSQFRATLNQSGIGQDHIVAIACERSVASIAAILACFCENAIPFLLDTRQDHDILAKLLDVVRPHGIYCGTSLDPAGFQARLPYLKWVGESASSTQAKRTSAPDLVGEGNYCLHSSGTCGLPRAFLHNGSAISWQSQALVKALRLKPGVEVWHTGSLASSAAFSFGFCAALSAGGSLVLDEPITQLTMAARRSDKQRVLVMTQFSDQHEWNAEKLLSLKGKLSGVMVTDHTLSEAYALTISQATDAQVWTGLCLAEASGFLTINPVPGVWPAESVGRPLEGAEIQIVGLEGKPTRAWEVGKLSYLSAPSPQKVASLTFQGKGDALGKNVQTGDWACMDEQDYLYVIGCEKSAFYRAGFLVNAREVEKQLNELPEVSESLVVAIPNDEVENEVAASIVPKNGSIEFTQSVQNLSSTLPKFMLPRRTKIVESILRTPSGKPIRFGQ